MPKKDGELRIMVASKSNGKSVDLAKVRDDFEKACPTFDNGKTKAFLFVTNSTFEPRALAYINGLKSAGCAVEYLENIPVTRWSSRGKV